VSTNRIQVKDPADVDDLGWDFTDQLGSGETIVTKQILPPPDSVTAAAPTETGGIVTARISGGTLGADYLIPCRVTTSTGRTLDRALRLYIRDL
jgi:hypothetical protein